MALIKLPGRLEWLQKRTIPFKVVEAAVLFVGAGFVELLGHGVPERATPWFALAIVAYPLLWITVEAGKLFVRAMAIFMDVAMAPIFYVSGIKILDGKSLFYRLSGWGIALFDKVLMAHDHLVQTIWVTPPAPTALPGHGSINVLHLANNGGNFTVGNIHVGNNNGTKRP